MSDVFLWDLFCYTASHDNIIYRYNYATDFMNVLNC